MYDPWFYVFVAAGYFVGTIFGHLTKDAVVRWLEKLKRKKETITFRRPKK